MTELSLRPIREDELPGFIDRVMSEYAQQKVDMGGIDAASAREQAARETERYFPEGRMRETDAIFLLVDEQDAYAGRLWIGRGAMDHSFILDVEVDASRRGEGLGRRLMAKAEEWTREHGLSAVDLHVFGGNASAIALYEKLGYEVTDLMMRKTL